MNVLKVKNEELEEYKYRANRKNPIRRFWMNVLKLIPEDLYQEIRNKPTDLVLKAESKGKSSIVQVYQFETHHGSPKVLEFLERFRVEVG